MQEAVQNDESLQERWKSTIHRFCTLEEDDFIDNIEKLRIQHVDLYLNQDFNENQDNSDPLVPHPTQLKQVLKSLYPQEKNKHLLEVVLASIDALEELSREQSVFILE